MRWIAAFSIIVPVGIVECANIPVCVLFNPVERGGEIGDSGGVVRRQSRYRCFPPLFMKEKNDVNIFNRAILYRL